MKSIKKKLASRKYLEIIKHYEHCLEHHGDSHLGVDWPNLKDAEKRYKVMLEVIKADGHTRPTVLDFGCGASHLFEYSLKHRSYKIDYAGLDISKKFVSLSKKKFPRNTYYCIDVLAEPDRMPVCDYVIMNGVFTEKRGLSFATMWNYFKKLLPVVFAHCQRGIAFNVMSTSVDWERKDLFHLPTDLLIDFMTKKLSRNFLIRNDYGLFEYTVYLYK